VRRKCIFMHRKPSRIGYLPAIVNRHASGTNAYSWQRTTTSNIKNGCPSPSFRNKPKENSTYIANPSRPFATNTFSPETPLIKRSKKEGQPHATPTRKRTITTPNGPKTASRFIQTEKSNSPWASTTENGKSRSSFMHRICHKDTSRKSNCVITTDCIWPFRLKMDKRRRNIKPDKRLGWTWVKFTRWLLSVKMGKP